MHNLKIWKTLILSHLGKNTKGEARGSFDKIRMDQSSQEKSGSIHQDIGEITMSQPSLHKQGSVYQDNGIMTLRAI